MSSTFSHGLSAEQIEALIAEAKELPIEAQPFHIARRAFMFGIRAVRAADAELSPEAIADAYRAWWKASYPGASANAQAVANAVAWAQHLFSLGSGLGGDGQEAAR